MIGRIFFILFFGLFAAFAVGLFAMKTMPMLSLWHQAQSWQAVPATIINADLKTNHGDDSVTYKVVAEYRYYFQGENRTGNRVGLSTGFDNIGSYHEDTHRYLKRLKNSQQPLTVWVDPLSPEQTIINREIRWGLLLFESVFFILFGFIGFGGMGFAFFSKSMNDKLPNADVKKPWLSKKQWSQKTILSDAKFTHRVVLFLAVFWNLCSIEAYFAIYDVIQGKASPIALVAVMFPIIGVVLIYWYFKLKYVWKKIGPMPLTMDPYPGSVGGQVGGHIDIGYSGIDKNKFLVKLSCIRNSKSGDKTRQSVVWQSKLIPAVDSTLEGSRISFCFDVSAGLPESQERSYPYHEWVVIVEGVLPDNLELERQYEIPVFRTNQRSSIRNIHAKVDSEATKKMYKQQVDLIMPLVSTNDGSVRFDFPVGRHAISSLMVVLIGGMFAAIGFFVPDAPTMVRWIFSGLGCLVLLSGIYTIANSLKVRIASEGVYTERYLLGMRIKKSFMASYEFDKFEQEKTSTQQSGGKHTEYFKILAKSKSGQKITVAEGLAGRGLAQVAVEQLSEQAPFI